MAKTRFSISMDDDVAEQIKRTAAQLGEDVSSFVTAAAMEVVRRKNREKEIFAEIDAEIAAVENGPEPELPEPQPIPAELATKINTDWDVLFGELPHRDVA